MLRREERYRSVAIWVGVALDRSHSDDLFGAPGMTDAGARNTQQTRPFWCQILLWTAAQGLGEGRLHWTRGLGHHSPNIPCLMCLRVGLGCCHEHSPLAAFVQSCGPINDKWS